MDFLVVLVISWRCHSSWAIIFEKGRTNTTPPSLDSELFYSSPTEDRRARIDSSARRMPLDTRISRFFCSAVFLLWVQLCLRSSHGWSSGRWRHRLPNRTPVLLSLRSVPVAISAASDANTISIPVSAAGIPRELEELALFGSLEFDEKSPNHESLESSDDRKRTVERVSIDPPIFILRNAITRSECSQIRAVALSMGTEMEDGKTVSVAEIANANANTTAEEAADISPREPQRKHSKVGWLENDRTFIKAIARRAHEIFLNGMPFHATSGIEPLQVVHYHGEGGEYVNHHDGNGRLLTVLYYLNGVGETWFPLANDRPEECGTHAEICDLMEARHACIGRSPGRNGVLVTCRKSDENLKPDDTGHIVARVNEGDAVAFYNYKVDGSINWKAFHSGLPVTEDDLIVGEDDEDEDENLNTGGKWIANHFYHFVPSHIPEAPPPNRAASTATSSAVETQ